jgi:hypothetical protein
MVHSVHHDFFKVLAACSDEIGRARVVGLGVSTSMNLIYGGVICALVQIPRKAFHVKRIIKG